jgi:tetratricopeptide (TPR) repeat protein
MKYFILAALLAAICASSSRAENIPDAAAVRRAIDAQIHSFQKQKKKATLGLVQQLIGLSISYGAPAYNTGDHAACFRFYADTADALVSAFPDDAATGPARRAIGDLKTARQRTLQHPDADHNAWTMRYAFDKTQIAWELEVASAQGLMRLGNQNFQSSHFAEAQDAYESAGRSLDELDGQVLQTIPIACRFAPMALANALFARKQYKESAEAVSRGIRYLPEWPAMTLDLRSLHHDPAEYEAIMEDLRAKIAESPDDASLQFLLGYELHFTGKKVEAHAQFERTLKLDPNHRGAKIFLHPGQKLEDEPEIQKPPTGSVKV